MDEILKKIYEEYQRVLNEATDMYTGEYCCDDESEEERYKEDEECLKYMKRLLEAVKKNNKSKKVVKTIVYATKNYFCQKVAVDENLTDDEVLKLWKNDEIDEASTPDRYNTIFDGDVVEAFIID